MWVKLDPKNLWGRLEQTTDYARLNITLHDDITDGVANKEKGTAAASSRRIRYGNGLFYIFKTTSKAIKFKYKFHHSNKDDYATSRQAVVEPQLCGKLKNTNKWIMLNTGHLIDKTYPVVAETEWEVIYKFKEDFEEFQFCLPFGVVFYYIHIEADKLEIKKPTEIKFGLLGSSVTNMSACYAASSLTSQIYRQIGINTCNLAIPLANSIVYKEILDLIKLKKNIKWYLLDTINLCQKNIDKAKQLNIKFACIACRWKYNFDVKYIFDLDNPCYNRDNLHLTTAGALAFAEKLIPILQEDL